MSPQMHPGAECRSFSDPAQYALKRKRPSIPPSENPFRAQRAPTMQTARPARSNTEPIATDDHTKKQEPEDSPRPRVDTVRRKSADEALGSVDVIPNTEQDSTTRLELFARASADLHTILQEQYLLQTAELSSLRAQLADTTAEHGMLQVRLAFDDTRCLELEKVVRKLEKELKTALRERDRLQRQKQGIIEHCGAANGMLNGALEVLMKVDSELSVLEEDKGEVSSLSEMEDLVGEGKDPVSWNSLPNDEDDEEPPIRALPPRYSMVVGSHGTWADA